jgi:hypothetical protein
MRKMLKCQLVALFATATLAAGCGSSGQHSSVTGAVTTHPESAAQATVTTGAAVTASAAHSGASAAHARGASTVIAPGGRAGGASATISSRRPAIVTPPEPPSIKAGPLVAGLSGSGSEAIGPLSEKTSVVLEWRTATPPLQIFNSHGLLLVNSNLPSGMIRLASGQYRDLHVGAKGPWTIKIHASA